MYLAETINKVLESKREQLIGKTSYFHFCDVLNRAFRKIEPYSFKYETYWDYSRENYSVSGIYDMDKKIKYVIFNFSKHTNEYYLKPKDWREFKFSVSQVCQHELIHQCQWSFREEFEWGKTEKLDFRNREGDISEEQEYLADPDEIEAYGHDIAMEIAFHYPKKNPYDVLTNIEKHRKLWSYNYYKRIFKNEDWSQIRNRLLKKTYKWISQVQV